MRKRIVAAFALPLAFAVLMAQDRIVIELLGRGGKGVMAVPEFRGAGGAAGLMSAFNETLWSELEGSGLFRMAPRTSYPLNVPQRPENWLPETSRPLPTRAGQAAPPAAARELGLRLRDWSGPPVNATYMPMGYAAEQGGRMVLFGWFYNVAQPDVANAQVFGKIYNSTLDANGARQVAREFAADILQRFGATSLAGTKIVFVSTRSGSKEIWQMDYDGSNQRPVTNYRSISTTPSVSPDGTRVAFTGFVRNRPEILIHSLVTGRRLPFYNQDASMNATPSFTPDGNQILFSSTAGGGYAHIYVASANGSNLRRLTSVRAVEVEPKVNPKNGSDVVFVSGRSGPQQIYRMNIEGTDVVRLTTGEGEAANPAWHPEGQHIAFAWTRGFEPGNFNIFIMDVSSRRVDQLTHGAGRNENPGWAPDGRHLVFSSRRGGRTHIYTMLADGTQVKQLTTQGDNTMPLWSR
ncbi:MAG TPA: DPP IV N-terminal domain-containing protein [Bryobacteraceae bacterium]|nr:DPP IV N-terminal domain-containing protein [Bryobacteraceae bacterium]